MQYISSIEASREVIRHSPIVPAWEAKFQEEAKVRTVYHGTRLEGNELSEEQAERVMAVQGTNPSEVANQAGVVGKERDIQEIINYRSVLDWINDWGKTCRATGLHPGHAQARIRFPFTESFRLSNAAYRSQRVVVRSVESGRGHHRPPGPEEVLLGERVLTWVNGASQTLQGDPRRHYTLWWSTFTHLSKVTAAPLARWPSPCSMPKGTCQAFFSAGSTLTT